MARLFFRYYPQPVSPETEKLEKKIFRFSMVIPALVTLCFWLVKFAELVLQTDFVRFGVHPRHLRGLIGLLTSPLVHADFSHLINNSVSFFILSTALFFFYRKLALRIFVLNYFFAGLFLWLVGRDAYHIGASGVIYGLAAFLFCSGIMRSDVRLLTISLVVTFLYGSLIWGLLPIDPKISWDGHWAGAISGFLIALAYKNQGPPRHRFEWENEPDDDNDTEDKYWETEETS
jgi:membrane associated rhomboid family serine protease